METIRIDEMTWVDVKNKIDNGYSTVIFGVGSTEQHGPSLPEKTDALQADQFANLIAIELKNALQAPTISVGCSDHHLPFPGTVSLRESTLSAIIEDYIASLARHGFKNIIIFISHGGNVDTIKNLLPTMRSKYPDIKIIYYFDQDTLVGIREIAQKYQLTLEEIGSHAGDMEASIVLYLAGNLVKKKRFVKGYLKMVTPRIHKKFMTEGFNAITENGVIGDQTRATAQKGKDYVETLKKYCLNYIQKALEDQK